MAHRKYELKQRAASKQETRRRILEAAVELHTAIGPAATTISAIAERAKVERLTVYRHFPSLSSLLEACGALTMETYPPPQFEPLPPRIDGLDYLERMLGSLYDYYAEREEAIALFLTDAERLAELREVVERNWVGYLNNARDTLLAAVDARASGELRGLLGQAVDFWAWRSLRRQGMANAAITALERRLVTCLLAASIPAP